jgi:hypothetical protein
MASAAARADVAILWSAEATRLLLRPAPSPRPHTAVVMASFTWSFGRQPLSRAISAIALRLAARRAAGLVLITEEQCAAARRSVPRDVFIERMTWGVDTAFYRGEARWHDVPNSQREAVGRLMSAPYVVLAGDQLRQEDDALELARRGVRVARVLQSRATAERLRREVTTRSITDHYFVFNNVPYPAFRFLLRHAQAYAGLVDATWQPAGWTVACEALASGIPAVLYDGMAARELRRLGAADHVSSVPHGDLDALEATLHALSAAWSGDRSVAVTGFAQRQLDLEVVGPDLVKRITAQSDRRNLGPRAS